jgi:membrane protein implicated in regulation of membrane protease activity
MWFVALWYLLFFAVIGGLLIALGVGIGFLLHAVIPELSLGLAVVAGAVFAVGAVDLFRRFLAALRQFQRESRQEHVDLDDSIIAIPRSWIERRSGTGRKKKRT